MKLKKLEGDNVKLNIKFIIMKKYILLSVLFLLIFNVSYNQNRLKISNDDIAVDSALPILNTAPFTNRSIVLDNNFSFSNFTFKKNWNDIQFMFDNTSDYELDKYSFVNNSNNIFFTYSLNKNFENLIFDDIFLMINNSSFSNNNILSKLFFIKKFEKSEEAVDFYLTVAKKFFKITPNNYLTEYYRIGKNINIRVNLDNNTVNLEIEDLWKVYSNSLKFSYDYSFLLKQFKEIDIDYSFRDIKFGTNLSTIKSITKFDNYKFGYKYVLIPKDQKYFFWKGFDVPKGGTFFYFTKDFKLAEVSIVVQCFNDYTFNETKNKLINIFGSPSIKTDEELKWVGKNITISIPSKKGETNYVHIMIASNYLYREYDKDY